MAKRKPRKAKAKGPAKPEAKPEPDSDEELAGGFSDSDQGDFTESDDEGEDGYRKGGYHPVTVGEVYKSRYRVLGKLGWGHFSTVWLCEDLQRQQGQPVYVAMKIQKSAQHYTEAACDEIELLSSAAKNRGEAEWQESAKVEGCDCDPRHTSQSYTGVVSLCDYFEHHGPNGKHIAMVFEVMGPNVLALIKKYNFKGVPLDLVRKVTMHTLIGLDYLHRVCGIIHTDLKPENVLVGCPLGVPVDKKGEPLVQSIHPTPGRAVAPGLAAGGVPKKKPVGELDEAAAKAQAKKDKKKEKRKRAKDKKKAQAQGEEAADENDEEEKPNEKEDAPATTEEPPTKKYPDPPYMKPMLKPSRSDPSLLNSFGDLVSCWKPPYHHFTPHYVGNPPLGAVGKPAVATKTAMEFSPEVQKVVDMDIFDYPGVQYKVVDLGNACWLDKHFSEDIQTRQYRSPEVILGAPYDTSADIWSLACMTFELATGDYLFDPKASEDYSRDEDHLALYMELLGKIPKKLVEKGKNSKQYFNRQGDLKHIKALRFWGLDDVLKKKYRMNPVLARSFANFLMPMLAVDPEKRASALDLLQHPWLRGEPTADCAELFHPADGAMGDPDEEGLDDSEEDELEMLERLDPEMLARLDPEMLATMDRAAFAGLDFPGQAWSRGLDPDDAHVQAMMASLERTLDADDADLDVSDLQVECLDEDEPAKTESPKAEEAEGQ